MAITLGLVEAVDDNGVYVSMPGSRGVLRGPYRAVQDVAVGASVLVVQTDDGEQVVVGVTDTPQRYGVFNVRDYGAVGDNSADDTAAIQAAIDAADDAGGGTVYIPNGTYKITGAGLQAKSASILGGGARSQSSTVAVGAVLQGSDQTGPVLTIQGWGKTVDFKGRRTFSDFTICGDGVANQNGLYMVDAHNATLKNLVIRDCRGVPLSAESCYFVTVEDCTINEPVDVYDNDTYYVELRNVNSWHVRGMWLQVQTPQPLEDVEVPSVGPSGAVLVADDGDFDSELNDFQFIIEGQTVGEGSLGFIDHRGNKSRLELIPYDIFDYGTVTTPWAGIILNDGLAHIGGNVVVGNLMGKDPYTTCYGVVFNSSGDAVHGVPSWEGKECVHIRSGSWNNRIDLIGSQWQPVEGFLQTIDDSGVTNNSISDRWILQLPQKYVGFFGKEPTEGPIEVTGSRDGNAALESLLIALDALGLIINSTTS